MWSYPLRLLIEMSMDLFILSFMDIYFNKLENWGYIVSFCFSIFSLAILISLLIGIRCKLRKMDIDNPIVVSRFGTLYQGLIRKNSSLTITEWFILRRMLLAALAFFGRGKLWLSFQFLFNASFLTMSILWWRIYILRRAHYMELINEGFILI